MAAVLLWRAMIDYSLTEGRSTRYGHAADHLMDCAAVDDEISDYGSFASHLSYVDALQHSMSARRPFGTECTKARTGLCCLLRQRIACINLLCAHIGFQACETKRVYACYPVKEKKENYMDKTLFITGASTGIGAATARAAVNSGWRVGLFARSKDKLEALAESLGDKAMALPGDATDLDSQRNAMETFAAETGGIDAAFANAGMGLSAAGTDAGDPEEWEQMIRLNILGVLWTVKAAMPYLKKRKGHLLLTGSAAGRRHISGSVYGASKWFVHGYGGNLSEEMKVFRRALHCGGSGHGGHTLL